MDLPEIIVLSKLQLKTDSSGEIKQGSLSKKGLVYYGKMGMRPFKMIPGHLYKDSSQAIRLWA